MLHNDASVLQGLAELRNKTPNVIEVTENEFVSSMRKNGVPDWKIEVHLLALRAGTQMSVSNGNRVSLRNPLRQEPMT